MSGGGSGDHSVTVLVVHAAASVRSDRAAVLDAAGYSTLSASGVRSAIECLEDRDVDCLVSGDTLEDGDGLALLDAVRRREPAIPFVLWPRNGTETLASDAISAGVTEYIPADEGADAAVECIRSVTRQAMPVDGGVRYDALVDELPGIVYRAKNDRGWPMEYLSDETVEVTGYDPETIVAGERSWGEDVIAEDRDDFIWEVVQDAVADRRPFEIAYPIETAAGDRRWVWERGRGVFGPEGLEALVGFIAPHTGEATQERERFTTLFETIPDPVVIAERVDDKPIVHTVNAAFEETFGYDMETVVGESIDAFIVPDDADPIDIDELADPDAVVQRTVRRETAEGPRDFLLRATVMETQTGPQEVGVYTDITDQKEIERDLAARNERLSEFASMLSHDIRTPLNVVDGRLALAAEECEGEHDHLAEARAAVDRMDQLVGDVLTLVRGETGVDNPSQVPLREVVTRAWASIDDGVGTLETTTDLGTVIADSSQLLTLFENLFRNSVEHGSTQGSVTVWVGRLSDSEGFYVADDGPGIPEDERDTVFERGMTTADDGTGFGLAIVDRIATSHGWTVSITESRAGGARFELETG
ncbi:MAG: ATP-binding protein [Halobacteriaceae archaeon]